MEVRNRFQALSETGDIETEWENMTECISAAAEKTIPPVERKRKQNWRTDQILAKMDERRKNKRNSTQYIELDNEIKRMCKEAKEKWLNKDCEETERLQFTDAKIIIEMVKMMNGKKRSQPAGCIQ